MIDKRSERRIEAWMAEQGIPNGRVRSGKWASEELAALLDAERAEAILEYAASLKWEYDFLVKE